jgi:flagella basal body P-ring formation protein FlgA
MNLRLFSLLSSFLLAAATLGAAGEQAATASTAVDPNPSTFTREQVQAEIARQLTDHYQLRGELRLELERTWTNPAPLAGGYELTVMEFPAKVVPSLLIRVRFQNAGRSLGEQMIPLHAQLLRDVYVVRTPQERDAAFDPAQMDVRRVDVLRERDTVATDDCEGDYAFAAPVQAGRVLAWRDLARRALVHKGQVIEVAAVDGTMTITTKALAMENGAAGDSIKVRNLTSKKDFTAYVVAEARAQVRF